MTCSCSASPGWAFGCSFVAVGTGESAGNGSVLSGADIAANVAEGAPMRTSQAIEDTSKAMTLAEDMERWFSENRRVERVSAKEFLILTWAGTGTGTEIKISRLGTSPNFSGALVRTRGSSRTLRQSEVSTEHDTIRR